MQRDSNETPLAVPRTRVEPNQYIPNRHRLEYISCKNMTENIISPFVSRGIMFFALRTVIIAKTITKVITRRSDRSAQLEALYKCKYTMQ